MARTVTKRVTNVMFGPAMDRGRQSIVISNGRQYTLEEYTNWTPDGRFQHIIQAFLRAADLAFGEVEGLEFETRDVVREVLNFSEEVSWVILSQGMIIQKQSTEGVEIVEEIDEENLIKTTHVTKADGTKSVKVWTTAR